jgi:hypothetical protein
MTAPFNVNAWLRGPQRRPSGRTQAQEPAGHTPDKARRNFTDPESRIMSDGFMRAYNAQATVDAKAQVIVAQGVTDCAADSDQLTPMMDAVIANTHGSAGGG